MNHPFDNPEILNAQQAKDIAGGLELPIRAVDPRPTIRPEDPPVHYTQALGEGGGHLPDLY